MELLSEQLNFKPEATLVPSTFSDEIFEVSRTITDPEVARQVFEKITPIIRKYRADKKLAIACGLLIEKQRIGTGMRALWDDLRTRFPDDITALRMLMRWYRRDQNVPAGIKHIATMFPECWRDLAQADQALTGLAELKAWDEVDEIMRTILAFHPADRAIRMKYIKILNEQARYVDAQKISTGVVGRDRMGAASQKLLNSVDERANTMLMLGLESSSDVISTIVALANNPRKTTSSENVVFYTGQLGTGGAERQMTRIATSFKKRMDDGDDNGLSPHVWVKHANAASGADFYLPMLLEAGVNTRVIADEPNVALADLTDISDELAALMKLLSPDILSQTCSLIPMFREHKTDVAYLWQDGGIVMAALAAIIAGVPRIVTSFRGLPPNLRPNLYRDEQPVLYAALARLPYVTFTANSQKSATAYEEWLGLAPGTVIAVPNATPAILPDGDDSDDALWSDITNRSQPCTKTVISVFRFDSNKRPIEWVNAAARYCKNHDDTRFVMIGGGALFGECEELIAQLGLQDRIFLTGIRSNIGFYMHKADMLLHLARMEGLPNVLIEAQLAGTAVLATPAGGTDEVVTDGVSAHILSDSDVLPEDELDAMLAKMLTDDVALAEMGRVAKELAGNRFSVETILRRTTDLFKQIPQDT